MSYGWAKDARHVREAQGPHERGEPMSEPMSDARDEVIDVDHVNAYGDGEHIVIALRTAGGWKHVRLTISEGDHLQGMLYLLTRSVR